MGFGFLWVLALLGSFRELIGQGTLFSDAHLLLNLSEQISGLRVFSEDKGILLALLPPGAFIGLGLMVAAKNCLERSRIMRQGAKESISPVIKTQID